MKDDGLGDWRIRGATRLANDVAAAYPGGSSHKAGAPVYLTTLTKDSTQTPIGFTTPSPVALAVGIALRAASRAATLRGTIALQDIVTPHGRGKNVAHENLPHLYDYFECCLVTVTFSFQALEVFCNETISARLSGTYELRKRNEVQEVDADSLQRMASTDEKLGQILPSILGMESPKAKGVWQRFRELRRIRDTTIHLKARDAYSGGDIDAESLFYQFFRRKMDAYPRTAVEMMDFFTTALQEPRWLRLVKDRLAGKQV